MNIAWCADHGAVMVTNDRGKKDRVILRLLNEHHVHAIFVYPDLRAAKPYRLARALLCAESKIEQLASKKSGLISHRLTENGSLTKRSKS